MNLNLDGFLRHENHSQAEREDVEGSAQKVQRWSISPLLYMKHFPGISGLDWDCSLVFTTSNGVTVSILPHEYRSG